MPKLHFASSSLTSYLLFLWFFFFSFWEMASRSNPVPKLRTSQSSLLFCHIIDSGSNNFQITFLFLTLISTVPGTWYAFNKWELLEYTLQQGPLLQPTVLTSPVAVSSHAHCTVRCFLNSLSNSDFAQARRSLWAVYPQFFSQVNCYSISNSQSS